MKLYKKIYILFYKISKFWNSGVKLIAREHDKSHYLFFTEEEFEDSLRCNQSHIDWNWI